MHARGHGLRAANATRVTRADAGRPSSALTEGHGQVLRGLLGHPFSRRVRAHPAKPYLPTHEFNEEQHVKSGEPDGLDCEEVERRTPAPWERRSSAQVGPSRLGAGPKPCRRSMLHTEVTGGKEQSSGTGCEPAPAPAAAQARS